MRFATLILPLLLTSTLLAEDRKTQLNNWFKQLASREPSSRIEAQRELMGIRPEELPLLREVVSEALPLRAAQIDPLHDIVTYVRIRQTVQKLPRGTGGFLGVSLPLMAFEQEDADERNIPAGVPILNRLPGFVAYRILADGDIILSIGFGEQFHSTATPQQLKAAVGTLRAGDAVSVRLQRGSQVVTVAFPLDGAPILGDNDAGVQGLVNDAKYEADQYFDQQFAPLLGKQEM